MGLADCPICWDSGWLCECTEAERDAWDRKHHEGKYAKPVRPEDCGKHALIPASSLRPDDDASPAFKRLLFKMAAEADMAFLRSECERALDPSDLAADKDKQQSDE